MKILQNLNSPIPIILASKSPRRAQLLQDLGVIFEVIHKSVDESFDIHLSPSDALKHIVEAKLSAFINESENSLVICADTMVALENQIFGKPHNEEEAFQFIQTLSGKTHQVFTGVGIQFKDYKKYFFEKTDVTFRNLEKEEINFYIQNYQPFDKAGAYGIQEWIGHIGIEKINGSYTNVMGLPTQSLFIELKNIMAHFSQLK